ncbi:MAG TPA: WG repeat-containing protein, partial [Cytophaga sp.]|nr:WG repeat-containing protein [Cytophaga sp.]
NLLTGKELTPVIYDSVSFVSQDGFILVTLHNQQGIVDITGREIIAPKYKLITNSYMGWPTDLANNVLFKEKIALVQSNEKWGAIDVNTGKITIPIVYDDLHESKKELFWASKEGKFGLIDRTNKEIVPALYNDVQQHFYRVRGEEGYYGGGWRVLQGGKWGIADESGQEIIPIKYDSIWDYDANDWPFKEGFAWVENNGKEGFLDKFGSIIVPIKYDNISTFSAGLVLVGINGKYGCLDYTGSETVPCIYDAIEMFKNGIARVRRNGAWGYIDQTGKEIVPTVYQETGLLFREGLLNVKRGDRWGYVNLTGREVIPCQYDRAWNFQHGLALVFKDAMMGFINSSGAVIIPFKNYDAVQDNKLENNLKFNDGKYNFRFLYLRGNELAWWNNQQDETIKCNEILEYFDTNGSITLLNHKHKGLRFNKTGKLIQKY